MTKPTKSDIINLPVSQDGVVKQPKLEPTNTCNGRLAYEEGYCRRLAGAGTDHEGQGRCKDHGGAKGSGKHKKSFAASEVFDGNQELSDDILKKFETLTETDPTSITNIDNEINVLRATFYQYMRKCYASKSLPHPGDLKKFAEVLAKFLEIRSKLDAKPGPKTINTKIFILYVNQINDILRRRIPDQNLLDQIAVDMENLAIPDLTNGQQSSN